MGIPVVIAENGQGFPVNPVKDNAPVMTVAENGLGAPIVIDPNGAPFIVDGWDPPPLIIGPLDGVIPGNNVFTDFSREFALAAPDAVVYFACAYTGDPVIEIAHGGEPLTILKQEREPTRRLLALVAAGQGLTIEAANLTIKATGGQLDGGAFRIVEMGPIDPALVGWSDGAHGNNPPQPLTESGTSGGTVKIAFVNGGADRTHSSRVEGAEARFSGFTVAGDPYPYDISAANPEWVLGTGWTIEGDTFVHTGTEQSTCSLQVPAPFYTNNSRRAFIQCADRRSRGSISEGNENTGGVGMIGPREGYVVTASSGALTQIVLTATGDTRISQLEWFVNARYVTWVFATAPAEDGAVLTPRQAYQPYWAVAAAEVLGQEYEE